MAKAADQTITWILLAEAVRQVASAYGYSLKCAEADLVRWLGKGLIRWRGELRGRKRDVDPGEGSAELWHDGPHVMLQGPLSESRVHRAVSASRPARLVVRGKLLTRPAPLSDYWFVRIEVARGEVIAAMSAAAQTSLAETGAARDAGQVTPAASRSGMTAAPRAPKRGKRKSYWHDSVDRVLRELFPGIEPTDIAERVLDEPKDIVKKVRKALVPKIQQSGREAPERGLILRMTGHWKSQ